MRLLKSRADAIAPLRVQQGSMFNVCVDGVLPVACQTMPEQNLCLSLSDAYRAIGPQVTGGLGCAPTRSARLGRRRPPRSAQRSRDTDESRKLKSRTVAQFRAAYFATGWRSNPWPEDDHFLTSTNITG